MPKKKSRQRQLINDPVDQEINDQEADNMSTTSITSSQSEMSVQTEVDLVNSVTIKNVEELVEKISESNSNRSLINLDSLIKLFQKSYFNIDENWNYIETLTDSLERHFRKCKPTEQFLPIKLYTLFMLQLDRDHITSIHERIINIFEPIYRNPQGELISRKEAIKLVSIILFLSYDINTDIIKKEMDYLHEIFKHSCLKGDGNFPNINNDVSQLHICALNAWCLLYSTLPKNSLLEIVNQILPKLHLLLKSQFLEMRIAAGNTIALIYERIRNEVNPKFKGNAYPDMIEQLTTLSTDSSKFRSKNDRKMQRHSFRDILFAMQSETIDFSKESIKIRKNEEIEITKWVDKFQYEMFCCILENGMSDHLAENYLLRGIFKLGLPVQPSEPIQKMSHKQRHLENLANSKLIKQTRQISRNKRMHALADFDN